MDSKVVAALIGLGGVSLGAFLGGVGYYLKSRSERQQNKKLVLFHLLEIRQLIKSSYADPKEIAKEYFRYCESFFKKNGLSENGEIPEELPAIIEQHMSNLLSALSPKVDESFTKSFEESLKSLCKTDPVLAFKLRGRERVSELLNAQEEYIANFSKSVSGDAPIHINELLSRQMDNANDKAIEELIKDIDNDISAVAWRCSVITWLSCKGVIKKKSKPSISFENLGIDEIFEKMIIELVEAANKSSQQDASESGASA